MKMRSQFALICCLILLLSDNISSEQQKSTKELITESNEQIYDINVIITVPIVVTIVLLVVVLLCCLMFSLRDSREGQLPVIVANTNRSETTSASNIPAVSLDQSHTVSQGCSACSGPNSATGICICHKVKEQSKSGLQNSGNTSTSGSIRASVSDSVRPKCVSISGSSFKSTSLQKSMNTQKSPLPQRSTSIQTLSPIKTNSVVNNCDDDDDDDEEEINDFELIEKKPNLTPRPSQTFGNISPKTQKTPITSKTPTLKSI
ncbi:uncharacterized protein LOC128963908 [Oppia nitens]|uniref:uncharacterized protein LOC128963908 n=1 Tax=Oppia nitens TaxID=1686743 RepID=UPI0023D9C299|nr:uncharacterized protein LOC128963908 [Oppia nitens]